MKTKIEWADYTFNPWVGCTKVSPACDNCYAEARDKRFNDGKHWGSGAPRHRTSALNWKQPLKWNKEAEKKATKPRVFCASLADIFDNEVPSEWRNDLFDLIQLTPNLNWLLLTKRISNAYKMLPNFWSKIAPHVSLGITVVNQAEVERDIKKLINITAKVRFISVEPQLGHIDVYKYLSDLRKPLFDYPIQDFETERCRLINGIDGRGIDWVIAGGESGLGARPSHPFWFESLRDQCQRVNVPFFFKQWGEWSPRAKFFGSGTDFQSLDPQCKKWPNIQKLGEDGLDTYMNADNESESTGETVFMQRVGKKLAGRVMDGEMLNQFPSAF